MKARIKNDSTKTAYPYKVYHYGYLLTIGDKQVSYQRQDLDIVKKCEACSGQGSILMVDSYSFNNNKYVWIDCGMCHGEGYVPVPEKKFHMHIYEVSGMAEVDIVASNEEEARVIALEQVQTFGESDCKKIILFFATINKIEEKK